MKNWKSTLAFFIFVASYVYSLYRGYTADILYVTGYIAFWSSIFMMLRSELTASLIEKLIDAISRNKDAN